MLLLLCLYAASATDLEATVAALQAQVAALTAQVAARRARAGVPGGAAPVRAHLHVPLPPSPGLACAGEYLVVRNFLSRVASLACVGEYFE